MFQALKYPVENQTCYRLDVIDYVVHECFQAYKFEDPLEGCLVKPTTTGGEEDAYEEIVKMLEANSLSYQTYTKQHRLRYEKLEKPLMKPPKPSIEEPPSLELKPLPSHLKYAFLEGSSFLPVIISFSLTGDMEARLLQVLKKHKRVFGWTISDIQGISPSICTHKILMEDNYKPIVQPQRRLNPMM